MATIRMCDFGCAVLMYAFFPGINGMSGWFFFFTFTLMCMCIHLVGCYFSRKQHISSEISTCIHYIAPIYSWHSTYTLSHSYTVQRIYQLKCINGNKKHPLPIQCQWIYLEFYTIIIEPNYKLAHSKYQNTKWKRAKKSVAGLWSRETVW